MLRLLGPRAQAAAKPLQSCPTLCDPIGSSPPGSPIPGILQARRLEWVAFPSPMHACMLSHFSRDRLFVVPWTAAHQAPPSTGFSRQEYWNGLPFPECMGFSNCGTWASLLCSMWNLSRPGIELMSLALAGGYLFSATPGKFSSLL